VSLGDNAPKHRELEVRTRIDLLGLQASDQGSYAAADLALDNLIEASEELSLRGSEDDLVCEGRRQTGLPAEPFIAGDTCAARGSQEEGNFVLGEPRPPAISPEVVRKSLCLGSGC